MAFNATPMQQKAIEADGNILVSAAAGSGKTAVLVERVIRKLTSKQNPISADRLLIVTFTNAAAAEMRSRIEKRLHEEILKNPDDVALLRQKHLLPSADICTIDSFCIKLIRENFDVCGVEPDFKVSDGTSLIPVCKATMSAVLEPHLAAQDEAFLKLLELCECEYDEQNLADTIERIYLYSRQLPFPEQFVENLAMPYNIPFDSEHPWYKGAFALAIKSLASTRLNLEKMANAALGLVKNSDKCSDYTKTASLLVDELISEAEKGDWDSFYSLIHTASLKNVPSTEKDDPNAQIFKDNKKQIADTLKEICLLFSSKSDDMGTFISNHAKAVNLLVGLITDYAERLFEAFKAENSFTFYNTEQMALNLLCEYKEGAVNLREHAKKLASRYDEVLVDEFQDVNDLQDMLFSILSNNEEKLFVVGDVKQSIYGFRGSNPQNFLNKKQKYTAIESAKFDEPKKIILSNNFRSRHGVCDAVNYFFELFMAGQCGSIVYNEDERLCPAAKFPETQAPAAELLLVDKCGNQDDDSLLQSEARAIVKYIKGVMCEGEVIKGKNGIMRQAEYRDFVILLDTMRNKAPVISEMLLRYGIPVAYNAEGFLDTVEISTALSVLKVIDNPKCDVELLTCMMSPIFGFTAEDMAAMRAEHKRGYLYSAVTAAAQRGDQKAQEFINRLSELRRSAAILPLDRFLSKLLYTTDWLNLVSAMSGGRVRSANLFTLLKLAGQYAAAGYGSIYGFIKHIKELPENSFKSSVGGGENCVRIMSMHQSKGLQFPVCIIANLASRINNADSISRVLYSENMGIAFKYYNEEQGADTRLLGHKLISNLASDKTIEERMRLLYVAMTRAEDRLCLVSACKDAENRLSKLSATISDTPPYLTADFISGSKTMGDWVLAASLLHPDAGALRSMCDMHLSPIVSDASLKVTVINEFADETAESDEHTDSDDVFKADEALAEKIIQNVAYSYPYRELCGLQAKASVSALANAAENEHFAFSTKPDFMEKNGLSAAGRGTAMHHIMQFISMDGIPDIDAELDRLTEWQFITEAEAKAADKAAIERFFGSEIYTRIMNAREVRREMRFLTELPASRLKPELKTEDKIIVQGAVDMCFIEDDGIVVLDFKTDRVEDVETLAETYGEQLEIYSKACEKIFSKPVNEKIIYSFHLSKFVTINA